MSFGVVPKAVRRSICVRCWRRVSFNLNEEDDEGGEDDDGGEVVRLVNCAYGKGREDDG